MIEALAEARAAAQAGEVPVGAVLVADGRIIACAGNRTLRNGDPTAHAEMLVLREGARVMKNHRLAETTLFELPGVNHRPWVRRGVMAQEAKTLLADFFAARRGAKENEREGEGEAR